MEKLSERIKKEVPELDWETAKKVIKAYREYDRELDRVKPICGICFQPLTPHEIAALTMYDFNKTCTQHRKYAGMFQISEVQDALGIEDNARPFDLYL